MWRPSKVSNKNTLYDSYIRAIRWGSDRLGEEGLIAFVTNGSLIDGNAMGGLRKCLREEFDLIYCLNLRGNLRTLGELSRREGDHVFATGSRVQVAITFLIKKKRADSSKRSAQIHYYDIGDYLTREQKLAKVREAVSVAGLEWQSIIPDAHHDWINQRDSSFDGYMPLGREAGKKQALRLLQKKGSEIFAKPPPEESAEGLSVFGLYSNGLGSNRDAWAYNFSRERLAQNMQNMIDFYEEQRQAYAQKRREDEKLQVDDFVDNDPRRISWTMGLKKYLQNGRKASFERQSIRPVIYRPFSKQWLYYDARLNEMQYRQPLFFPDAESENRAVCVSGIGANQFSSMMVDVLPDLNILAAGTQCFPFYVYDAQGRRHDNIGEGVLQAFRGHYKNEKLSKEDIFHYCYGVLHWPRYRMRFASDLLKGLPRLPFVRDFQAFAEAGARLAGLHTGYERVEEYGGLSLVGDPQKTWLTKMRFAKEAALRSEANKQGLDKARILFNGHIRIEGIPSEAYEYVVNGRPAIEWIMERYRLHRHKDSGLVNDPNEWPGGGDYALSLLRRVVSVSLKTVAILRELERLE